MRQGNDASELIGAETPAQDVLAPPFNCHKHSIEGKGEEGEERKAAYNYSSEF